VRLASLSLRLRSTFSRHRARASPVRLSKEEAVGKGEIIRLTAVHLLTQIKSCFWQYMKALQPGQFQALALAVTNSAFQRESRVN
jgi:hypothetical protein